MADLSGVSLELVNTVAKAGEFMTWLGERRPGSALAVDTETGQLPGRPTKDALSPWHGRLRLVQVGDGLTGWAIPWDGWHGVFLEAMDRFDGQIIMHNIAFDSRWFALQSEWKLPWNRCHDTMIQAHIVDPLGRGGLKALCARYVDARATQLQATLDSAMAENGWNWGTVPITFGKYWQYGALDTVLTARLWEIFQEKCGPNGPYRQVYDLEMATRRVVTQMELNGARVDLEYSARKYQELHDYAQQVSEWGKSRYKMSIGSTVQLVKIFEDKLGYEITELTPAGNKKCDKEQLKKIVVDGSAEAKELARAVLAMRKAGKLAETYFANFTERHIDGLLHPNVRTLGARTSRMSITDPALQTLPKGERIVREAFIPREEEEVILTSDLDQVEFRMFAGLSQDPQLINLFNEADRNAAAGDPNADAFTYIMRDLYHDPTLTKKDPKRKLIKGYIYGRLYGAGVAKQALTAGVPESEMRQVADAFDRSYPGAKTFTASVEDAGMRRLRSEGQAYVLTKTGRRLPCDDDRVYTLVNYLIQGGAAEVFKIDLLKLDAAGLTEFMVVPVHDEIVMSVPREMVDDIKPVIRECMTTRDPWAVPLTAGCDGPYTNWGEGVE